MASLEAKLLGERAENYCSSDEGEHEEDKESPPPPSGKGEGPGPIPPFPPAPPTKWGGTSQNTGPKGVLRDWELFKEHERLMRVEKERELIQMVKDSSLSCRTDREEQQAEEMMEQIREEIQDQTKNEDLDLDELLSDKVLEQFIKQRMDTMSQKVEMKFGPGLVTISNGDQFLEVVDNSDPRVPVIIHIYDDKFPECSKMNDCLTSLSELYPQVQFCKIRADAAGVSLTFKAKGIPALLVYKGGNLIGNFVQLKDEFGTEFYHGDVENFLIENGMIQDKGDVPKLLAAAREKGKMVVG